MYLQETTAVWSCTFAKAPGNENLMCFKGVALDVEMKVYSLYFR